MRKTPGSGKRDWEDFLKIWSQIRSEGDQRSRAGMGVLGELSPSTEAGRRERGMGGVERGPQWVMANIKMGKGPPG